MFRRAGILLSVLAVFGCAGGHWAVLQSIAWANMLRDYSQDLPLTAAIQKTFSGKAPCALCCRITKERKSEQSKPQAVEATKKLETAPIATASVSVVPPVPDFELSFGDSLPPHSLAFPPPSPVPIAA